MSIRKKIFFFSSFIFLCLLVSACDFTPRLHKEILKAHKHILLQDYKSAITQYELILKKNPPDSIKIKLYYHLGEIYSVHLSDNNKALFYFRKIKDCTDNPIWLVKAEEKLGEIKFTYLKDYKNAIKNYYNLSKFVPKLDKLDLYEYRLGISYLNFGKLDESLETFKKINKNQSHKYYIKSYYYLGMISFQEKKWRLAVSFWKEYIKREKRRDNIVQTKFLIANAYETMEQLKLAYDLYYTILGEYPNTEVIHNRLEAIYARRIARKR